MSFNLEEILPDIEPVRLPRHQAGGAPQSLAVTLLADYSLRSLAWLPSAAIVALLAESGVTTGGARTAISRLARRGVLESHRMGRNTFYRLTLPAAMALAAGGKAIATFTSKAESWDGFWTLIAFSVPQEGDTQRRALRGRLRWLGYSPLYDALWISPHGLPEKVIAALAEVSVGTMTVFRARRIELDGKPTHDPLSSWDLPGIAARYESFMARWSPLPPRISAGDIGGVEALRTRTEVMDTYRRFVILDPWLPARMMPPGWLRERARELFVTVYDGLADAASRHVSDVVLPFVEGAAPEIAPHSVAELLAGLRPGVGVAQR